MRDPIHSIERYNSHREPERLALKFQRMAEDAFVFFRGSAHLFYEDLPSERPLFTDAPAAWLCGDLHLENFGSYKGENGLAYFDLNDFDEGCLAPVTWELARFLTSLWLAADQLGLDMEQRRRLEASFLDSYVASLVDGKARWVERDVSEGMVGELLSDVPDRASFVDKRTWMDGNRRRLKLEAERTLPLGPNETEVVLGWLRRFAQAQADPSYFTPLDVVRRVTGTGSLGVGRYLVLVQGKGAPAHNTLLDIKEALPSCLEPHLRLAQPPWAGPAERVVALQRRMQAVAPARLQAVRMGSEDWVLRELQPSKNKLALDAWQGRFGRLERALRTMGAVVAWAQLRSSGRQGSASADALIAFGGRGDWRAPLIAWSEGYAETARADYERFCGWLEAR